MQKTEESKQDKRKGKSVGKNIILFLGVIILCLILAEVFIRLFAPQPVYQDYRNMSPPIFTESDTLPWELKPNAEGLLISPYGEFTNYVRINKAGMRSPELLNKTNKIKRLLFLGDSFTFGFGVSEKDSYPRRVESLLNNELESNFTFEVLNGGWAGGFTLDTYNLYLSNNLNKFKPDVVITGFFVNNDISDLSDTEWIETDADGWPTRISSPKYYVDEDGKRRVQATGILKNSYIYKLNLFLFSHSQIYALLRNSVINLKSKETPLMSNNWDDEKNKNWNETRRILKKMKSFLDKNDVKLVVVVIHSKVQTVEPIWEQYENEYKVYDLNRTRISAETLGVCRENNIYCLDLYTPFLSEDGRYFFEIDGHWNEKGHELGAKEIFKYLVENRIVS